MLLTDINGFSESEIFEWVTGLSYRIYIGNDVDWDNLFYFEVSFDAYFIDVYYRHPHVVIINDINDNPIA